MLKNMFMMNHTACYFAHTLNDDNEIRFFRFKGGVKSVVASITDTEQSGLLFCETDGQSEIVARLIKDPERKFNGSLSNDDTHLEVFCGSDNRMLILQNPEYGEGIITDALLLFIDQSCETKILAHVYIDYDGKLIFDFDYAEEE
ncbi:MAG: hypothetical protein IKK63_09310 [Clostridia bacterium]|nr:hypothetical protein [Clostridia bacterium]